MPADLHIHTFFSDGTQSPEEIVELAAKNGLTTIAITDHDVVTGIDRAEKKGKELNVEIIPGIELTTDAPNAEIHILGYYIDTDDQELLSTLSKIQKGRENRIFEICEKLIRPQLNVEISEETLDEKNLFIVDVPKSTETHFVRGDNNRYYREGSHIQIEIAT